MSEVTPREPSLPVLPAPPKGRRWLKLLLAAVIFLSGFVVGAGASVLVIRNRLVNAIHHPDQAPDRIANRLRRPLGLSDAQTAEVKAILQARQAKLQEIRRRVQPEVEAQIDLVEQEVAAVLQPEQKEKWHSLVKQLRSTWLPAMPPSAGPPSP